MTKEIPHSLKQTTAIVGKGGLITATSKGKGHDAARLEIARILEVELKIQGTLIKNDHLGNPVVNVKNLDAAIMSFQDMGGVSDRSLSNEQSLNLQVDGVFGPKTLKACILAASVHASIKQDIQNRAPSCIAPGLGQLKGMDCPKVERFAQQVSLSPHTVSRNDAEIWKSLTYVFKTQEAPPSCKPGRREFKGVECRSLNEFIDRTRDKNPETLSPQDAALLPLVKSIQNIAAPDITPLPTALRTTNNKPKDRS